MQSKRADLRIPSVLGTWAAGTRGPLYARLGAALAAAIERGDLTTGDRLPAERVLAELLSLSRSTVVGAYEILKEAGLVESRRGSGTAVKATSRRSPLPEGVAAPTLGFFKGLLDEPEDVIDLSLACPLGLEVVPTHALSLAREDLESSSERRGYLTKGVPSLRRAVADRLGEIGLPTHGEQILITSGAQQAISLVASLFVQRGDAVVLESPTYPGAIDAFTRAGARLVGVSTGPDPIRPAALRESIARASARFVYLMPTYHNPTGATVPEADRREMAKIGRELAIPIVEDHTLSDLSWGPDPPRPIASYSDGSDVIYIGATSKIFWAGLRVGWIRADEPILTRLARLKVTADLGTSLPGQILASRLVPRTREIAELRRGQFEPCLDRMCHLLTGLLPEWSWTRPEGGLAMWIHVPGADASRFAQVALRRGVAVTPGPLMSPDQRHDDFIRVSYVVPIERIEVAVQRLAEAWSEYRRAPAVPVAEVELVV